MSNWDMALGALMAVMTCLATLSHIPAVEAWAEAKSWGPWALKVVRQLAVNPLGAFKKDA